MSEIKVGIVLGKIGNWQRKYLVTHITQTDAEYHPSFGDQVIKYFTQVVCLKYLGEFYADGRSKPSLKQPEREVKVYDPEQPSGKQELWLQWYGVDRKWDGSRLKN
jgi:hypothetical protein